MSGITAIVSGQPGPGAVITAGATIRATISPGVVASGGGGGTPDAHASTHAAAGSDPVSLAASQITSGVFSTARLGTGTADDTKVLNGAGNWTSSPNIHVTSADRLTDNANDNAVLGYDSDSGGWAGASDAAALANLRTAIGAAATSHTHSASDITSGTLSADRMLGVPVYKQASDPAGTGWINFKTDVSGTAVIDITYG